MLSVSVIELPRNTVDPFAGNVGTGQPWRALAAPMAFGWDRLGPLAPLERAALSLMVDTSTGFEQVTLDVELLGAPDSDDVMFAFRVDALAVAIVADGLAWWVAPRSASVTARADALRLLKALSGRGRIAFAVERSDGTTMRPHAFSPGSPLEGGVEFELAVFDALATLEEWSGERLDSPTRLTGVEVAQLLAAKRAVQAERFSVEIPSLTISTESPPEVGGQAEIVQEFVATIGVREVGLGVGTAHADLREVERRRSHAGGWDVTFEPEVDPVTFVLAPPADRRLPPRRTQQLPRRLGTDGEVDPQVLVELGIPDGPRLTAHGLGPRVAAEGVSPSDTVQRLRAERLR